jgi:hypothetical protein
MLHGDTVGVGLAFRSVVHYVDSANSLAGGAEAVADEET